MWQILTDAGIDPAPERASSTWAQFLRSQAQVLLGCDFFETVTPTGVRMYVLVAIEHAQRRIRILGATPHPTAEWVTQAARNLVMDLQDASHRARFPIRDRDGKFPHLLDAILTNAGIEVVPSGVQMPKMNSIVERWIQTCRHELLDRTLIWNQRHLLHALREYKHFYNNHRPHQGITNTRPLRPLPRPITDPAQISQLDIRRRLGGILNEYHHAARPAPMTFSASAAAERVYLGGRSEGAAGDVEQLGAQRFDVVPGVALTALHGRARDARTGRRRSPDTDRSTPALAGGRWHGAHARRRR
ncbi:hypothetical protein GCM10029964_088370 [Kibdelosporangium lantanae]